MRLLSATSIVASGCFARVGRLATACLIAAVTLGAFVIVAGAQTNPYGSAQTNPYGGAQTNPYAAAQTNTVASAQTTRAPMGPP